MSEYTYEDIIIDPTSEEAKNAIGKECYMAESPGRVLNIANSIRRTSAWILSDLADGSDYPFRAQDTNLIFGCIIVKKEEHKHKYIPFESMHEFISAYYKANNEIIVSTESMLSGFGLWLKSKEVGAYKMVSEIWDDGVVIGDRKMWSNFANQSSAVFNKTTTWDDLIKEYIFLDGTPCGKEVK